MSCAPSPVDAAQRVLARLRAVRPVVHCLTNAVTVHAVAQAVRAVDALPVMAWAPDEADEVAASADALVVNLGTPSRDRLEVAHRAAAAVAARARAVVIDPVGVGISTFRTAAARRLLDSRHVAIVRANRGEAAALLGAQGTVRGVEAAGGDPAATAAVLARRSGVVAAVTGQEDCIHDGTREVRIPHATGALAGVVGAGDLATALVGAAAAVEPDRLLAASSGLLLLEAAARVAAARAAGPGSLLWAVVDALAALTPEGMVADAYLVDAPGT